MSGACVVLKYFKERFQDCEAWQISATGKKDYTSEGKVRVAPAVLFLKTIV